MKSTGLTLLVILFSIFLLTSCQRTEETVAQTEVIENPDMAFSEVTYVLGRTEFPPVQMSATEMEMYNDKNLALLTDVSFSQTDYDGSLIMSGTCDSAKIDTTTYDTELQGKVYLDRPKDELSITGEDITWDNERQRITTDKEVVLMYDSGSEINGVGLTCDFKTSRYEFDRIIEGRLQTQ